MKVSSTAANDDYEFDLHQNYHNAIECLINCERIIEDLQDRITSKDKQIAALEEKLVQMSLELASSKALEDEHRLMKRRMTGLSDSEHTDGSNVDTPMKEQGRGSSLIVDYSPVRATIQRNNRRRAGAKPRPELSRSWSAARSHSEAVIPSSIPHTRSVPYVMDQMNHSVAATHNHVIPAEVEPRKPLGFGLSRQISRLRMSLLSDEPHLLDSSNEDSAKESTKFSLGSRCDSMPPLSNINMSSNGTKQNQFQQAATRRLSSLPKRRSMVDDSSNTSRRLSNFGQYILRKGNAEGNNDAEKDKQAQELEVNFGIRTSCEGRDSISSSRSGISGVVFPVSSSDCLVGLDNGYKNSSSRTTSANNAQWPTYG